MNSTPSASIEELEASLTAHAHVVEPNCVAFLADEMGQSGKLAFPTSSSSNCKKASIQSSIFSVKSSIFKSLVAFVDSAEAEVRASEQDRRDHLMCQLAIAQQQRVTKEAERLTNPECCKKEFRQLKEEMKQTGMVTNSGHQAVISTLLHDRTTRRLSMPATDEERDSERVNAVRRNTEPTPSKEVSWEFV